jgi:cytoskeletal protein CcmA (bactofilin family)
MTTIGRHLRISGDLTCAGDLTIEGLVHGRIAVPDGTLVIGETAEVDADLKAARILVLGRVHGTIAATYRIELGPTARVEGDVSADQIAIAEGARVNGAIDMGRRALAARVAEYRAGKRN